ncbi:natural resistance-associated macrophage protein-domain-containing protein [Pseudoneurospora amorphoporcata]|uniref:Natural resistance-associated macrophage protein-domain-containing protein n=1 Tax=Pseudoneurospora amorphoporcata TaxID=241081 RepID=A0AAN6SFC4_9PEZI|nr:natural resistance-associated macrophage protein-domain-containing protein [Pseudoneurospora amorphoporcata]
MYNMPWPSSLSASVDIHPPPFLPSLLRPAITMACTMDRSSIDFRPFPGTSTANNYEQDEKKVSTAQVSPSVYSQETQRLWVAGLRTWFGLRPNRHSPPPVYQPRPPPSCSEPASIGSKICNFFKFLGPGAVISVAYVDPDNYQTAISAGAEFQYKLLFMVLVSNLIAIYIQSLCVKLGTVTGMDLAQMNRRWLPRWLDLSLYVVAEASIIATDLGQVIGTAIALNILIPKLPLAAACVISVVETLLVLLFYTDTGELRRVRILEAFVSVLVMVVFVTICIALSMVDHSTGTTREILRGYVPSRDIFVDTGLYASCAILGGTLMPHALYVGTSLSRARLYHYDAKRSLPSGSSTRQSQSSSPSSSHETLQTYRPSLRAIKSCLGYSVAELTFTLFTVAIFVNSALLVIAGSAFYTKNAPEEEEEREISEDLYSLYALFRTSIAPAAGIMFAVSLLFSGISAGIVSTMSGQIIMEGALDIRLNPFLRRLITRCVAIVPALVIALAVGKEGLSKALLTCNYLLAIALIPITFPVVWYTCRGKYMMVPAEDGDDGGAETGMVDMKNNLATASVAWLLWVLVVVMDVATVVLVGLGITKDEG